MNKRKFVIKTKIFKKIKNNARQNFISLERRTKKRKKVKRRKKQARKE